MNSLFLKSKILGLIVAVICLILICDIGFCLENQERKAKSLAYYTMGVIHDLKGNSDKAIEEFEKSAKYEDSNAVHLRLGADYARLGRLEEAIKELKIVTQNDQGNEQAHYLLALIYSTQREFDKAAEEYEKILMSFSEANPENIEIYGYLAQLYYSQKKYDKAIGQFEIIHELTPQDTNVLFLLGSLYLEIDKKEKAIESFSKAIQYNPEDDNCLNSLGYVYAEQGKNLDEAQKLIERALKIDPDNGAYFDSLGWVYYQKGNYDKALEYLKSADRYLKDPVIYEHLGDVYYKLEKFENAKEYWTLSLEILPGQEHVLEKLKKLK